MQAVRTLLTESNIMADEIVGVGLSGQMHSLVVLDAEFHVIRPAILWNDQRTGRQCEEITQCVGGLDGLLAETNNMMLTGYSGGKLLWLRENEPENYARICHVLLAKDYIRYRLTGMLCTDYSDASGTGLFDVRRQRWSEKLLAALDIPASILPPAVSSVEKAGVVTGAAAALCGIPEGTPVFGGGGDAVLSLLVSGVTDTDRLSVTLGTSGVVASPLRHCIDNPEGMLQVFCGTSDNRWAAIGCTLAAAGSYEWFCNAFGEHERTLARQSDADAYQLLDSLAAAVPAGSGGLLFYPYLNGERCPLFRSDVRAAFLGADATMGKGYFARAVLEGVIFSLRQVYELMRMAGTASASEIIVSGGGAKSKLWRQILANVFGLPVRIASGACEGSAIGAALTAGVGFGLWRSVEDAAALCHIGKPLFPQEALASTYEAQYAQYCNYAGYTAIK